MRTKLSGVVLFGVACVAAPVSEVKAAAGPWMEPAHAEDYVFIGKDVWEVATGKKVAAGGAPLFYQDSKAVKGAPGRFWLTSMKSTTPTLAAEGMVYSVDGAPSLHPTLDGKPPGNYNEFHGIWIAEDLRRVIWIEKGDFWRGVANWPAGTVDHRQQVTKLGVFAGKSPLLWYGHVLFVDGRFDPAKPVVRIDLDTGATEEMETFHVFHPGMQNYAASAAAYGMVSPSGCCLFDVTPETIYTYDVRTGKAGAIPNALINNPDATIPGAQPIVMSSSFPPVWIADDVVVCMNDRGVVTRIDIGKQRMEVLRGMEFTGPAATPGQSRPMGIVHLKGLVPGSHLFDVVRATPDATANTREKFKDRILIDLETGKEIATVLPEDSVYGSWLDGRHFIYSRKTGGLSGVGTWIYDRTTDKVTRIAPGQLETTRMSLLRGRDELWAVNTAGGVSLVRAKLDGSGSEDLGPCMMFQPLQFPSGNGLDLGFEANSPDPWKN